MNMPVTCILHIKSSKETGISLIETTTNQYLVKELQNLNVVNNFCLQQSNWLNDCSLILALALAKQGMPIPSQHEFSAIVLRGLWMSAWYSIVCGTVTAHQVWFVFCVALYLYILFYLRMSATVTVFRKSGFLTVSEWGSIGITLNFFHNWHQLFHFKYRK